MDPVGARTLLAGVMGGALAGGFAVKTCLRPSGAAFSSVPKTRPTPATPRIAAAPPRGMRRDSTVDIDRRIAAMGRPADPLGGSEPAGVLVIGVCGGSGSGKSTVSEKLVAGIGDKQLAYICHDWYYRDQSDTPDIAVRAQKNYDHPNALETELLVEHVKQLKQMRDIYVPDYNFAEHTRFGGTDWHKTHARLISAAPIVLVEGILLFENKELRDLIDIRVFVDADADLRFIRRMMRDIAPPAEGGRGRQIADVVQQFTRTVRPMHNLFVEPMKKHAHIVLPMNEPNETADKLMLAVVIQRVEQAKAAYLQAVAADRERWESSSDGLLSDTEVLQVVAAFRAADKDGSGALNAAETRSVFVDGVHQRNLPASHILGPFKRVFDAFDTDADGNLNLHEFKLLCSVLKAAWAESGASMSDFSALLTSVGGARNRSSTM